MTDLDVIKNTLESNTNLSNDLKDNIFELAVVFNKQFPEIALDNLNSKLENLKIERISNLLTKKVSRYDMKKNTIFFNEKELVKDYDARHLLMVELLNIISTSEEYTGFNVDNKFEALNLGYTEILANNLVGNNGEEQSYQHEIVMTNLLSIVISNDILEKAYFENDYRLLLETVRENGLEGFKNFNSLGNYYSKVKNWDQNKIQELFVNMIKNCEFTKEQISAIDAHLIRNNECLDEKGFNTSSINRFELIKDSLEKEQSIWIEETRKKVA